MCPIKFKYFLLFSLFFSISFTKLIAQPAYVKMYDRIPMKVQLWGSQWYSQSYVKLKEMGADIVMADQLDQEDYDSLYKVGIKIIPLKTTDSVSNYIAKYTEGAYTVWEAEGKISQDGDAELERETSKTFTCNKNGKNGIATNIGAAGDTILWGPGYFQQRWYTIDSAQINYTAKFHLLIDSISYPSNYPSIENNEDVVCTLQVTTTELVYDTILYRWYKGEVLPIDTVIIVKVKDFNNLGVWDTLDLSYDLMDVPVPKYSGNENKSLKKDASSDPPNIIRYIEFKIIWSGLSYIQLFADKVVLQDERGTVLMFNPLLQNRVVLMSRNAYTNWSPNFETTVLGWHTKDEPDWIDHLEPIRFINHLIDSANAGNRQLFITIAGSWNGRFGDSDFGSERVSKLEEIVKRNKMQGNQVNYYLYDYPYNESDPEYLGGSTNIGNMLDWHLNKINKLDSVFVLSLQTGLWNAKEGLLEKIPTKEQFLYNLNVGLLYGAKEIDVSNYFYKFNEKDDTTNTSALYNYLDNYYTPLWYTIRDTVSPRLKGPFGKTLRNINQTIQYPKINASNSYNFISNFSGNLECLPATADYDLGFFKDSFNADYFMIVSRWYNFSGNCPIYANLDPNQFDYTNISLTKYNADTTFTVLSNASIKINLAVGDAELIKVAPVVKYGGLLAYNDTIKVNTTLSENMTIDAGKVLQINEGKTYTITDTITFTDTSSFITGYGYINRTQNGWIRTSSWNKSLFKGRSGSHPKLIWSKHPDITNVIEYKIYRNHANGGWQYIITKSSSTFEYIDSTITIIEGMAQANETSTQYRITATHRPTRDLVETSPSNTILYHRVEGQGLEKQKSGITRDLFTYNLDQNYPNPFNPTTTINYSIAEDGIVTLEILNILGERIKILVNDFKTRGNHNISFNASSLASGVYIYKIQSGDFITSKKMILLK